MRTVKGQGVARVGSTDLLSVAIIPACGSEVVMDGTEQSMSLLLECGLATPTYTVFSAETGVLRMKPGTALYNELGTWLTRLTDEERYPGRNENSPIRDRYAGIQDSEGNPLMSITPIVRPCDAVYVLTFKKDQDSSSPNSCKHKLEERQTREWDHEESCYIGRTQF